MEGLFLEGLFLQASLIFALGAQNIFVLESGIKKQRPLTISFVCFLCDLALIMLGVAGAGTLFSSFSQLKIFIGLIGVVFLFHYGLSKILIQSKEFSETKDESVYSITLKKSIILAVTFSILNPHAYLDAFILIGGYSSKYDVLVDRLWVGWGAACFSLIWFLLLSSASSIMRPVFSNTRNLKFFSTVSGLVLIILSIRLGQDVYGWIVQGPHSVVQIKDIPWPRPVGLAYSTILF